jgi:hypothetical protein
MSDEAGDLYGKIDALLGKRVGFAGAVARHREENDFPLLTEVVEPAQADAEPIALDYQRAFHPPSAPVEPAQDWPEPPPAEPATAIWGDAFTPEPEVGPGLEAEPEDEAMAEENYEVPAAQSDRFEETPAVAAPAEPGPVSMDLDEARLEALLRRVVREELQRLLGQGR